MTTKWGGLPHWEFPGTLLGSDGYGDWIGFRAGTLFQRPGSSFVASHDHVTVAPRGRGYLATFWPDGGPVDDTGRAVEVYVDVVTSPDWDGGVLRVVDLDLDVVRHRGGEVLVDDEDEFAAHQERFGYPADVVAAARRTCDALVRLVRRGDPPFDDATAAEWLRVLRSLPR